MLLPLSGNGSLPDFFTFRSTAMAHRLPAFFGVQPGQKIFLLSLERSFLRKDYALSFDTDPHGTSSETSHNPGIIYYSHPEENLDLGRGVDHNTVCISNVN